jgi:uncharacterized cysteine cluster protein YcgN (CxxCxxCC family)
LDVKVPFWKAKSLHEMSRGEWESICDGCGLCCLEKVKEEKTGIIRLTSVACEFLDTATCRCMIYGVRTIANPTCIKLTPKNINKIRWLPWTCAYRSIAEGRELSWWHPLVSGDKGTVHETGVSVRNKVLSASHIRPEDLAFFL